MKADWKRATKAAPCPICARPNAEHRSTWCISSRDGAVAVCPFTADGAVRYIEGSGYLHRLNGQSNGSRWSETARREPSRFPRTFDWAMLDEHFRARVRHIDLAHLAKLLGVSVSALNRLGAGLRAPGSWTFPMRDGARKIIGLRVRDEDGGKRAIHGSHNGLFVPDGFRSVGLVIVCEGPTDTAAVLTVGLAAVGCPCQGCGERELTRLFGPRTRPVVLGHNETNGADIAERLAGRLRCGWLLPPNGIKDARQWIAADPSGARAAILTEKSLDAGGKRR